MSSTGDLINFDVIEGQKENIQALPSGRSARALAALYSPQPLDKLSTPTPSDTQRINDVIRKEFEDEILNIAESDDPLDVYDRYVKWTLDAYPSAQATPQSQLLPLLERATKSFLSSSQYKNDPRYLKLWLNYIRFFSDAPRETYAFLARHGVGDGLALFYEEFAAWLEAADRWTQAEEVFRLGIEREARPAPRLIRKFDEFQQRLAQRPQDANEPSSPAIPTIRPALAAKIDPFASAAREQASPPNPKPTKPSRSKMTIFTDDAEAPAISDGAQAWQSIGSLADRKKENMMEPKPWVGETLKAGGKKSTTKLAVFKDEKYSTDSLNPMINPSKEQLSVNPRTGRQERVFVQLEAIYHSPHVAGSEYSFEELMALHRGWMGKTWESELPRRKMMIHHDSAADITVSKGLEVTATVQFDENGVAKERRKGKKLKVMELNETQVIKTNLSSPSGSKMKRKVTSEPTMTLHTRAATDEIYNIFSQPLQQPTLEEESDEDSEESDDDNEDKTDGYVSGDNTTSRINHLLERDDSDDDSNDDETAKSVSEWSDFTAQKHIPDIDARDDEGDEADHDEGDEDDEGDEASLPPHPDDLPGDDLPGDELATPVSPQAPARTTFVPIPPEDYEAPTRPYRDPFQTAQNRLPFMTPIAERTESSVGVATEHAPKDYFNAKTPSKDNGVMPLGELMSSPVREANGDDKIPQPQLGKAKPGKGPLAKEIPMRKGPIITDIQCNPVADYTRHAIFEALQPPLSSYDGFHQHEEAAGRAAEIRKYVKASKAGKPDTVPVLNFPDIEREYVVKKELGAGAFAPVYLVENTALPDQDDGVSAMGRGAFDHLQRRPLEALKMEDPPSAWEFYVMRQAKRRLGVSRASESIVDAYEMHLYADEGFLIEEFRDQGTLLDLVNHARCSGTSGDHGLLDESVVMFFTIELFRTMEALHSKGILHGDLKADNCLVRFDAVPNNSAWSARYERDGTHGWASKGVALIDFGRGIDMQCFTPDVQFIADWKTGPQDCPEMRECRPWTYQIDYFGLAGIIHTLLFGKYIETVPVPVVTEEPLTSAPAVGLGTRRHTWKLKEPLKRWWQTELWQEVFGLLLNPVDAGESMPVLQSMKRVREQLETYLEANCEKGAGLQAHIRKLETAVSKRK